MSKELVTLLRKKYDKAPLDADSAAAEGGSMRLLIDIPKEFVQHFQADRFEDSLHRLSADAHLLAGLYEQETASMLIEAFATAVPVPPHGRLIDADALCKTLRSLTENEYTPEVFANWIENHIDTIIPALPRYYY